MANASIVKQQQAGLISPPGGFAKAANCRKTEWALFLEFPLSSTAGSPVVRAVHESCHEKG